MKTESYKMTPYGKYRLQFYDGFESEKLRIQNWIPYYLPHWSTKKLSIPRYNICDKTLVLKIDDDQKPWCPEFNGNVKVSSLQTGGFSGKIGSKYGQHRFSHDCIVREEQILEKKYTPKYGYFEMIARCDISRNNVVAFWMIGFEEKPENSSEICVFELKGENIRNKSSIIGYGVHPFGDPRIQDEFYEEEIEVDVTKFNTYSVEWTKKSIHFYINNNRIRTIQQSPDYEMQFMLNIYDVENLNAKKMCFYIDYIAGYSTEGY